MSDEGHALGINFSGNNIYYAVNDDTKQGALLHIGKIELNFPVLDAILGPDHSLCTHITKVIDRLREKYTLSNIRLITHAQLECWTTVPKIVYDDSKEREAHLAFLIKGMDRQKIETFWYEMSNHDFRFLTIRDRNVMSLFEKFVPGFPNTEFCSDFEVGLQWVQHSGARGSFMSISCNPHTITISSYLLGKLRAATCLRFRHLDDLPYIWKQSERHMKWMKGYHEEIMLFGSNTDRIAEMLRPFWDGSAEITVMDNLYAMKVNTEEQTYSFPLEEAFPAIMMATKG
jgi:hypothetical protein